METIRRNEPVKEGDYVYEIANYATFTYKNASGNCKHCYLDRMSSFLFNVTPERIERLNQIFDVNWKITFGINVTNLEEAYALDEHYTLISRTAIPTGYNDGFQYHCIYFTNSTWRSGGPGYKQRLKDEGISVTTSSKKINTPGNKRSVVIDVERILSYKSKYWLKRYLQKLIS